MFASLCSAGSLDSKDGYFHSHHYTGAPCHFSAAASLSKLGPRPCTAQSQPRSRGLVWGLSLVSALCVCCGDGGILFETLTADGCVINWATKGELFLFHFCVWLDRELSGDQGKERLSDFRVPAIGRGPRKSAGSSRGDVSPEGRQAGLQAAEGISGPFPELFTDVSL